ncbi:MAG: hypothetical protein IJZ54_04210 [Clostridia bacterium]|nr:hypothetical protein [Clostridia bacterium]
MIKGINHKIIEITDTDSVYYERAYLLVSPVYEQAEEAVLRNEAKKLLANVGTPSSMKGRRTFLFWFLRIAPSVLCGVGAGTVLGLLL